jgi:hypothetical protein
MALQMIEAGALCSAIMDFHQAPMVEEDIFWQSVCARSMENVQSSIKYI